MQPESSASNTSQRDQILGSEGSTGRENGRNRTRNSNRGSRGSRQDGRGTNSSARSDPRGGRTPRNAISGIGRDETMNKPLPPARQLFPSNAGRAGEGIIEGVMDKVESKNEEQKDQLSRVSSRDTEVCVICASTVVYHSAAPCNHRTCHICSLRMRALYKTKACAHCRVCSRSHLPLYQFKFCKKADRIRQLVTMWFSHLTQRNLMQNTRRVISFELTLILVSSTRKPRYTKILCFCCALTAQILLAMWLALAGRIFIITSETSIRGSCGMT
jgi:hypothetical protein